VAGTAQLGRACCMLDWASHEEGEITYYCLTSCCMTRSALHMLLLLQDEWMHDQLLHDCCTTVDASC
jgi:hypothetical protein